MLLRTTLEAPWIGADDDILTRPLPAPHFNGFWVTIEAAALPGLPPKRRGLVFRGPGARTLGYLPDRVGEPILRLLDDNRSLSASLAAPGPHSSPRGGARVPIEIALFGPDPPETARSRRQLMDETAASAPEAWDVDAVSGELPHLVLIDYCNLSRFARQAGRLEHAVAELHLTTARERLGLSLSSRRS